MDSGQFQRHLEQSQPAPVYLFQTDSAFLVDQCWRSLLDRLVPPAHRRWNGERLAAEGSTSSGMDVKELTPEVRERLYRKFLADRPGDLEVRRQLLAVYRDAGRQAELVEALRAHVRNHLGGYKAPRVIEFVADLPVTTSGKVSRKELRALDAQRRKPQS
jgi:acyl-CoA synthetase (AMP-forming)/AMP-acid ligase II